MYGLAKTMSDSQSDFVASSLRLQLVTLQNLLSYIEVSQKVEVAYVEESLRRVEKEFHRLRKFCSSN